MSNQICMCCEGPAERTQDNEGYSSCCNDRIGYADELEPQDRTPARVLNELRYAEHGYFGNAARNWNK